MSILQDIMYKLIADNRFPISKAKIKLFGGEDLVFTYLDEDIWCLYIMQATRIISCGLKKQYLNNYIKY